MKDVFICHASEDKDDVVRPLTKALQAAGISVWLDEGEIDWGDSITEKVNNGIADSRFTIVVFSDAFFKKNWPKRELNAILNIEASGGPMKALPLIVGGRHVAEKAKHEYPLQNDKRYLTWDGEPQGVVEELLKLLKRSAAGPATKPTAFQIPMPAIKRTFTDRDRNTFLSDAFKTIRRYFEEGLKQLGLHDPQIETDLREVNSMRFAATVYYNGNVKNQCIIWLSGSFGSTQISYFEGRHLDLQNTNAMNDWLNVEPHDNRLYLKPSGFTFTAHKERLNPDEAAEYFWRRFTQPLQY